MKKALLSAAIMAMVFFAGLNFDSYAKDPKTSAKEKKTAVVKTTKSDKETKKVAKTKANEEGKEVAKIQKHKRVQKESKVKMEKEPKEKTEKQAVEKHTRHHKTKTSGKKVKNEAKTVKPE